MPCLVSAGNFCRNTSARLTLPRACRGGGLDLGLAVCSPAPLLSGPREVQRWYHREVALRA
eukprot:CAMPEP_0115715276 /NCGR_PEP_ID=MMETSP0272-20121206/75700_1 /TAXON_ID=71861 /ORGANISM="Scrippsiella trochoidea, Strain CCMP3099" /LENGTH=60 /DNA_ID=CAMNT_0003157505 /DNA_START=332 /DNA_END=510 /DNA_ORIENTATION=+